MDDSWNYIGFATLFAFLAVFFGLYGVLAPRRNITPRSTGSEFFTDSTEAKLETESGNGFDRFVRPMLRNFLPQTPLSATLSKKDNDKITELLIRSGNPWGIRPEEYRGTQFLFALLGFFIGVILAALNALPVPFFIPMVAAPLMGYVLPFSIHNTERQKRSKEVTGQLPEALDLLVVSMSSGQNFEPAMAQVTPKMPDGLLKQEFSRINEEIKAGRGLEPALNSFAHRASSDETEGFAKAIVQAQKLGSDVTDTLKSQSQSVRTNYEAKLEKKIASLSSRMFLFLVPTMLPGLLITLLAPSLTTLMAL